MRHLAWLCLLWLVLGAQAAVPETPQFRSLGVADGLPSSGINAIAQDGQGYIWLASKDGLARYDGVDFQTFQHSPGDPSSLPGNALSTLHIDAEDRIWVAVEGLGVSRLDADRRGFSHLRRATQPAFAGDEIWAIASTADGATWFGSFGGGLSRLDRAGAMTLYQSHPGDPGSLPADNVLALAVDAGGSLWVGTTAGLARWTGSAFERIAPERLSAPVVFSLSAEADGRLWIGTAGGLDLREPDGGIAPALWRGQLTESGVMAVHRDRQGSRWIATRRGLNRERDGVVQAVAGAATTAVLGVFEDHEGGLWFASPDRGVLRLPSGWRHFSVLDYRRDDPASLGNLSVQGMAAAGVAQAWLVGSSGVLDRLNLVTGQLEHVLTASDFPDRRLWSVLQRRDGSVWIGHQLGLTRLEPSTLGLSHWRAGTTSDAVLPGPINLLCEDANGLLWSSSLGYGLQAWDSQGRVRHTLRSADAKTPELLDPEQLLVGPDGALWLAGGSGLQRWDKASERLLAVAGAPAERVYSLLFQSPDTLWLHRLGALERYRWNGRELALLQRIGGEAGLPAVDSGGVLADGRGHLWLTTPRGLWRYDPVSAQLRQFGVRDGLPSQEFINKAPLLTAGIAIASTAQGVVLFDPMQIGIEAPAPRLAIDRLSGRRAEDDLAFANDAARVRLQPDDRDLRISARLLAFDDAKAHRYQFRLHGYDSDWVDTGSTGERVFSRLEPGDYRLELRAANADGVWSAARFLGISVDPPWWRTLPARAGFVTLAGLGLAALALAYRRQLRRRHTWLLSQQRRQMAEHNSEAKSRFLATLGHEIRTPMTGVLGMAELLLGGELADKPRGQVQAIQRAGQHLLRLLNDALDLARIEAGKLQLDELPFAVPALLDEVAALLRPLAEAKGLQFCLQRAADTPAVLRGDVMRVRQIVLNLGSNAIKFTERGEIALRASALAPQGVLIEVSDSGPGLSDEQQARLFQRFEQADGARTSARYGGSGLGLAICQELAEVMAGRIDVISAPGQGASFRVSLPLPRAELEPVPSLLKRDLNAPAPAAGGLRILLVEDEPMIAEVVCGLLQTLGHEPVPASQALAALAELAASPFDLVLCDLDLPGMDGLQLARLLRAQGHGLPIIALTARADADCEAQAAAAGMDGFLRKPVTAAMLQLAIETALPGQDNALRPGAAVRAGR